MKKELSKAAKSCFKNNTCLSGAGVLAVARNRLGQFLPLRAAGYVCTTEQLLDVLLTVSAQKESLEQVCADLQLPVGDDCCQPGNPRSTAGLIVAGRADWVAASGGVSLGWRADSCLRGRSCMYALHRRHLLT